MNKKLLYILLAASALFQMSCSEDFLDRKNLTQKSLDNYYARPQDIDEALAAVYSCLYTDAPLAEEAITANLLSDNMFGGGGPDDIAAKNTDGFQDPNEDTYLEMWRANYRGIFRCNAIIEGIENADYQDEDLKKRDLGETYFMRAFFNFRMAKFFGGIPVLTTTIAYKPDAKRNTIDETYAQIASDLKMAIELMPDTPYPSISVDRLGHANKWIAEAYMARVYLFYTGYKSNTLGQATSTLPLIDGGSVTKAQVVTWLEDCMTNSGYALSSDFRNLWPYAYTGTANTGDYAYARDNGLAWVGEEGPVGVYGTGNYESMFMIRYASGFWDDGNDKLTNRYSLFFGIRGNSLIPFGEGWGWGTVNPDFVSSWNDADLRKKGSVIDLAGELSAYEGDKGDHETGYVNKKYTSMQYNGDEGLKGMFYHLYKGTDDFMLWHMQDFVMLRYADVLLMASELKEDASYMNQIRRRAGLTDIAYSLEALKKERKYEFAFEGLRWFDMLRWGDTEAEFAKLKNVAVRNSGKAESYSVTYPAATKGLLPVPESEVRLSDGALEQNPGW